MAEIWTESSNAATYERARRLANAAVFSVHLQRRRLQSAEPEDHVFALRRWTDVHFLVVALTRLRRAAGLAKKVYEIKRPINRAIKAFELALPDLTVMRDVAEHIDQYAIDIGKHPGVERQALECGAWDGTQFDWMGFSLNTDEALEASIKLFEAIQVNVPFRLPRTLIGCLSILTLS